MAETKYYATEPQGRLAPGASWQFVPGKGYRYVSPGQSSLAFLQTPQFTQGPFGTMLRDIWVDKDGLVHEWNVGSSTYEVVNRVKPGTTDEQYLSSIGR